MTSQPLPFATADRIGYVLDPMTTSMLSCGRVAEPYHPDPAVCAPTVNTVAPVAAVALTAAVKLAVGDLPSAINPYRP